MDDLTFRKIEQSIADRKKLHLTFLENVKTYKPFLELEEKAFSDGALDKKTKELMAPFHLHGHQVRTVHGVAPGPGPCKPVPATGKSMKPSTWPWRWAAGRPVPTPRFVLKAMAYFKAQESRRET